MEIKRIEPLVAAFIALTVMAVLLETSEELELGRLLSFIGLMCLVVGILSIFFERIMFGKFKADQ